ncbi:LysR family transcriptional regulator [Ideonella dechloratans]|uniref:LysR family transcriptional regulator n=1 Tax=Ideonella dechloratans TaxID=36863 RepID=UPI001E37A45A|nr:LysR substrate-binding domain-containing protein [Ideonella dechloratans]
MMNPRHLDLDLLRTLVAIADSGSFSTAAERLGRSQSAVSLQVKRLEEQVGQPLLDRAQGRLNGPTEEGRALLDYARRLLRLHDEACSLFSAPGVSGQLRVGLPEELMEDAFPAVLQAFAQACPRVTLSLRSDLSVRLGQALEAGELDLAIVKRVGAGAPQPPAGLGERGLRQEALVWFTGEGSEAAHQRPLPLAVFQEGCVFRVAGLAALAQAGIEPVLRFTGHSATGIRHAVAAGLAVAPLPRGMAQPGLVAVRQGLPPLPATALVARWRGAEPLASAAHLLELLQRQLWAPAALPA